MIIFFVCLAVGVAALGGAYAYWARRVSAEIAIGATTAFARLQDEEPALLAGIGEAEFAALYHRVTFPRFPKYFLVSLALFVLALPAVFGVLSATLWGLEQIGAFAEPVELAKYVPLGEGKTVEGRAQREEMALYLAKDYAGFYYFFGVIGAWLCIVAVMMRRYHGRRAGDLRDELLIRRADVERAAAATAAAAAPAPTTSAPDASAGERDAPDHAVSDDPATPDDPPAGEKL